MGSFVNVLTRFVGVFYKTHSIFENLVMTNEITRQCLLLLLMWEALDKTNKEFMAIWNNQEIILIFWIYVSISLYPGPLFTKRSDVLS